jgi:hypothetical protein
MVTGFDDKLRKIIVSVGIVNQTPCDLILPDRTSHVNTRILPPNSIIGRGLLKN